MLESESHSQFLSIDSPIIKHIVIDYSFGDSFSLCFLDHLQCILLFFSKIEEFFTVFLLILYYVSLIYRLHVVEPLHSHGSKVFKLRLQPPTLFFYSDGTILKLIISSLLASQKGCSRNLPISWNQPRSVPVCLLSHLEIFQFKGYRKRREEKQFVAYILANSKCLKTAGISQRSS
ncbi:unnamed protein product [Brassica rapa]|uniref:FBD domain-containing protein n=1 Tax=Brassica campestris TaxID=3711 RepID=A0A3P6BWM5_BRACM|nr:unnamed protein product [Brassica rapa]VDD03035.1 unnamed protein product [Brassica rapa]